MIKILLIIIFLSTLPFFSFAHPGRTDANGCHINKKTTDYHCHTISNKIIKTEARQNANAGKKEVNDTTKCGTKNYCKEMISCEEANYFLNICNLTRLDGDNDGIPCESICK